ncbi:MAG TPA: hypothetical protein VJ697_05760 [Nitrososphaeraceae archaeon]|nr:hypothetical protein [Nitrososphaeraceae archaeon]
MSWSGSKIHPVQWEQDSELGNLQPSRYLTLRIAAEKALEFERQVIGLYNDSANNTKCNI